MDDSLILIFKVQMSIDLLKAVLILVFILSMFRVFM
jgi:hypothetical protein